MIVRTALAVREPTIRAPTTHRVYANPSQTGRSTHTQEDVIAAAPHSPTASTRFELHLGNPRQNPRPFSTVAVVVQLLASFSRAGGYQVTPVLLASDVLGINSKVAREYPPSRSHASNFAVPGELPASVPLAVANQQLAST